MKKAWFAIWLALVLVSTAAFAQQDTRKTYIVQLADPPVATYAGTIPGLPATRPAPGQKLNIDASTVNAYIRYLETRRDNVLAVIPPTDVVHRYQYAFNGFAASMSPDDARKLRSTAGVVAVTEDEARSPHTTRTPGFLGLTAPGGLWSRTDPASHNVKGEDVIIGIIDGGLWPEDPSFSDKVDPVTGKPIPYHQAGTLAYGPPPAKWKGICQTGPGFTAAMCQNKLIGARIFDAGFLANFHVHQPNDYASPRDSDGHGSHTMSTAGGNEGVDALIGGVSYGAMSGVAPRARVAAYKVCWRKPTPDLTCFTSDSVAAIDQAVADGVDVLNYSISGTKTNYLDPAEVAFFNAVSAGVFVAASAGNSGPGNEVAHMSPWLATVAASTHDRFKTANVVLGNAQQFNGASTQANGLASTPLIHAENAGVTAFASLNATDQTALRRCFTAADRTEFGGSAAAALDPAKVAGKIVLCTRGNNVLVNKAAAVKAAGGVGLIIQNVNEPGTSQNQVQQPYVVPAVHLDASTSDAVQPYARQAGATASFTGGVQQPGVIAPVMADFSSRGPSLANSNVLKPDITAPGVDVIAAYVPDDAADQATHDAIVAGANGRPNAASLQGTSMSSPHVAGAAALLRQLHPDWSPAAIRSAMMTSAGPVKLANGTPDTARFGYGAGHLNPNGAADPLLVYDAGSVDYARFLCGIGSLPPSHSFCTTYGSIVPWNLNLPSLTGSEALGKITFRRTVRNVSGTGKTLSATASVPGWAATVSPATLTLAPDASGTFDVTLTRTTAANATYSFGDLVWSDGATQVKSPVTVRGILFTAPSQIDDTRATGTKVFTVGTGYDGILAATPVGLTPATRLTGSVGTGQTQCFDVAVPAGAAHLRVALFNADTAGGASTDLDLSLSTTGVATLRSENDGSNEQIDVSTPKAGTWSACVKGFFVPTGSGPFTLSAWVLGPATGTQTLRVALPSKIYIGGTASVAAAWSVPAGSRYLGIIPFRDGNGTALRSTLVAVEAR